MQMQKIVIVGGGAGGLELATKLGRYWGRKKQAEIHLVDASHTHLWKPLLHEVATGALDSGIDELNYQAHGKRHGFQFQLGRMSGLDRASKTIQLAAIIDGQEEILPQREVSYDQLIIALGSVTNDFGTKGAADHCFFLDGRPQAERFHQKLLNQFLKANGQDAPEALSIAIVGAGATGVELSAELYNTTESLARYGMSQLKTDKLNVNLVEAGSQILPALPKRISNAAKRELEKLGVNVLTETMITEVTENGFITADGQHIDAKLKVWAAGVKAPDFLNNIDGLESSRANQLMVNDYLQTTQDADIFAIGDCSFLRQADGTSVPPRAQAAHQQASHVFKVLKALASNKTPPKFQYHDKGSLVSLSRYSTVGSLMGNLTQGSMMIEGRIARLVYVSLYRLHQIALHGYFHTVLLSLVGHINKVIRPRLKLH